MKLIITPNPSVRENRILNPRQTDWTHLPRFEMTEKTTKMGMYFRTKIESDSREVST